MAESVDSSESFTAGGSAVVKKPKKFTESPHVLAMRALKAISKTANGELRLSEVPHEILFGENIDFQSWSLILTDDNLKELSEQRMSQKLFFLDSSAQTVKEMFKTFWTPLNCSKGLITLDLSNAKGITDFGLTCIARNNVFLQKLNLTKCTQITDVGLREVGLNCISLLDLNISSLHEIDGYGLVSVAECCRQLMKLDVSNCKKLQKYALIKIFYNCPNLEEVNLSGNKDFGDEEIRVLAQNCPDLLSLHASECPYVSDQSILTLAQYCPDIDLIDVSRSTMAFRITDVALSALGQKAFSLSTLRLSGCEQITDVGVTWLAEGCKVLRELDISRCNRITDAGLRFLGNNCHSLTHLNVSFAKQITDIGVSSLSVGCPKLKHLNCHGAFLLSDPRLTGPTKGAKMESWQTVIGIAALSMNCPEIESLDLSGCFRLNIALHTYVSKLKSLKVLNLMGCNQSSTESLEAIGKHCTELEEVVLTDCGKGVNNVSVKSFAMHCKALHTLTLTRCDNVKGGAIKAIALHCNSLTKLDLTGCKNLTDSTLLYLCEVDRVPKLKTLSLIDIPQLTDSILAWISIKSHDILLLALKGTCISHKAVMSVRDRFPHSDALTNENFFGFWPKYRIKDRRLINSYYYVVDGITRIQSKLRVHLAKRRVRNIQHERRVIAAHHLLHRVVRGFLGRCKVFAKKTRMRLEQKSAVIITSIFHRVIALSIVKVKRIAKMMRIRNQMAVKIQLCFREHRDYQKLLVLRAKREAFRQLQIRKAIKIQTFARKYFARNKVHRVRVMKYNHNQVINRKATKIQKVYRGMVDRRRCKKLKHYRDTINARRLEACIKIQRKVRYLKGLWIVRQGQAMKKLRLHSAIKIQAVIRGALARIHVAEIATERNEILRNAAALKIQGRLRMLKAKAEFQRRMRVNLNRKANFDNAANIIINQARIKLACLRMKKFRNAKISSMKEKAMVEINAAVKIQSLQRGIMGRAFYMAKLREKKGKWKELFDEKLQKRFFYNKLSGEIRYRMPQDLLDLIPHPNCDNCSHSSAVVECSECNELFCQPCFNKVHDGGRRKLHQWRAIYDYYNKRLDYGDGVFPCKWPTEVMQDEVQGWMLRVAPVRNPTATYPDGWEVYDESTMDNNRVNHSANYNKLHNSFNTQGMSADGSRQFYFNRYTFETSYEMPAAIAQYQRQEAVHTANSAISGYYDADGAWVERPHTYYGAEAAEAQELEYYRAQTAGSNYEQTSQDYDRLDYSYGNYPVTQYDGGYDESGQLLEYPVNNNYMVSNGGTPYYQQQQTQPQQQQPYQTQPALSQQQQYQAQQSTNTSRPLHSGRLMSHEDEVRYANHYGTDGNHIIDENYEYTISDDNSSIPTPHEFSKYSSDFKSFSPQPGLQGSVVLDSGQASARGVGNDEYKKKPTIVPKKLFKKA